MSLLSTLQIPQFSHLTYYESNAHKSPVIAGVIAVTPNTRMIKIIKICLTAAWVTKWRDQTTTRATAIRSREESGEYKPRGAHTHACRSQSCCCRFIIVDYSEASYQNDNTFFEFSTFFKYFSIIFPFLLPPMQIFLWTAHFSCVQAATVL